MEGSIFDESSRKVPNFMIEMDLSQMNTSIEPSGSKNKNENEWCCSSEYNFMLLIVIVDL